MAYAVNTNSPAQPVQQTTGFYFDAAQEDRLKSKQLGTLFVPKAVRDEICDAFDEKDQNGFYNIYGSKQGVWAQIMLANRDGDADDGQSYEYDGSCKFTAHITKLPITKKWLHDFVNFEALKSIRIFVTREGGMIVSHRDYLEFEEGFIRVHMPVVTNPQAVNSENNSVYHMKAGEVWSLIGEEIHSALNDSSEPRLHLVMDFAKGTEPEDMFLNPLGVPNRVSFKYREAMTDMQVGVLKGLTKIAMQSDIRMPRDLLNRLHFYNLLPASFAHDLLVEAAMETGSEALLSEALTSRKSMIGE